eukprot:750078-Hanusia_phi.AAC.2
MGDRASSVQTRTLDMLISEASQTSQLAAGAMEWQASVTLDGQNMQHVVEQAMIKREFAVRRMYRDVYFQCKISNVQVVVNEASVRQPAAIVLFSDAAVSRLAIDAWPADVVAIRDLNIKISYTLELGVHGMNDGSFMAAIALPSCSFSFCPVYSSVKVVKTCRWVDMLSDFEQVVFLIPGLAHAECYAAKPTGQPLPSDAAAIPAAIETLADKVVFLLPPRSLFTPESSRQSGQVTVTQDLAMLPANPPSSLSPWQTPPPLWVAVVRLAPRRTMIAQSSIVKGSTAWCFNPGTGLIAIANSHEGRAAGGGEPATSAGSQQSSQSPQGASAQGFSTPSGSAGKDCSPCAHGQYAVQTCTQLLDRVCAPCPACSPGTYRRGCGGADAGKCVACPSDSFAPHFAYRTECSPCRACGRLEYAQDECTATRDSVCESCSRLGCEGKQVRRGCGHGDRGECETDWDAVLNGLVNSTIARGRSAQKALGSNGSWWEQRELVSVLTSCVRLSRCWGGLIATINAWLLPILLIICFSLLSV